MSIEQLRKVELILSRYRQQLTGKEIALTTTPDEDKARVKLQIADLKTEIKPYEEEYWDLISQESEHIEISEVDAQSAVTEIIHQVAKIELDSSYPHAVIQLLQEIKDKLEQTDKSAAAKLKGVISSIPPFLGIAYEIELDTESFFRKNFPTLVKLINGFTKKKRFL